MPSPSPSPKPCVAFSTCANADDARKIARALVGEGLAACVNQVPGATSTYRWQGKVVEEGEVLLVIKTRMDLVQAIAARFAKLHPYDTPELVTLPIEAGSEKYLGWLLANTEE